LRESLILIDADYTIDENGAAVRLFCKDKNGRSVLVQDFSFKPYFFIQPKEGKLAELKKKVENLDTKKLETKILKVETIDKMWQMKNVKLIKVTIDNPRSIPDVRNAVKDWKDVEETYEYDIPFAKRYIIDKQLEPMNWIDVEGNNVEGKKNYQVDRTVNAKSVKAADVSKIIGFKILAFDTEFVEENGKPKLIMLSIACNDGYKAVLTYRDWERRSKYVEVLKDEKDVINRFLEILKLKDADFVVGYNSDGFDFPELRERAAANKVALKIGRDDQPIKVVRRGRISSAKSKGRVHIDIFNFINHILAPSLKSEVLTLNEVAQELLGVGKRDMKYREMAELWNSKNQMGRLVDYNMWDSALTLKLAEHILPQIFALSRLTGLLSFDVSRNTYSQLVEAFFMRKAFVDKVLIPNRPKTDEIEKRRMAPVYKGAIVIEPKAGIHSNILVFDFRSLYPTIIVTHNIDPWSFDCGHDECKRKNEAPDTKWYFCIKNKGFIPKHLENLIKTRQELKKRMKNIRDKEEHSVLENYQYALKILANATYGYFGFFGSKWYRRECGAAAAAWGRYYITSVVEEAKKEGFEIIYGDTDSLMLKYPVEVGEKKLRTIGKKFIEIINDKLPGIIELEFRDLYKGGIFVKKEKGEAGAKKRYALVDYNGNIEIRGFETVRRDWCELSKKIQRDVLITVLRDKNPVKAVQIVRDTVKKIKEGKVSLEDLTIFEQITRPISEYEQIGPHVRAAQKAMARGRLVGEGIIVAFVITKGNGSISDRAEPVEDVKPKQYDPDYYIDHQIIPAAMRVLKALGYSEQEILSGKVQKRLVGFLKKK